ncbi:unnamed protein product [Leptidea sinapis]|uniref:Isopropylmalate dehydrogenase-like domain-containing protein n=1 Tax=Leptidea sinapis TaxID=189913 RepID=A0A5E4QNE7_9NEOP|nr:unnamed protein product [Leptidea sinapis]
MAVRLLSKVKVIPELRNAACASSAAAPATLSDFDLQHKTPVIRKQKLIPKAQYGGRHAVTMLPGGGIGPECMGYVREIFKYIGAPVDFEVVDIDPTMDNDEDVQYAITTIKRNGVTTVHKANIMKLSDGLFLETSRRMAKEYPEIEHNDMIIDNCCMQLVARPHQFDVMLMTNLYGSIVSNVVCGILGGAGLLSGRNYGDHYAVFEPGTRNTGTAIAGKNVANPIAMINASIDMLEHLGHHFHADLIRRALNKTVNIDRILTPDVGGTASSTEVVGSIIGNIGKC